MDRNFIKKTLQSYIGKGNFIIYPFGENGISVKNILKEYFDVSPRLIVDNVYCQYNHNIIDFQGLKKEIREDDYVILTIADRKNNEEMEKNLLQICDKKRIINLEYIRNSGGIERVLYSVGDKLLLSNILPFQNKEVKKVGSDKIKVRIFYTLYSCWTALKTVYRAFDEDEKYDISIIIGNYIKHTLKTNENLFKSHGMKYMVQWQYDSEEDSPDIIVLFNPWEPINAFEIVKKAKLVVAVSPILMSYEQDINDFVKVLQNGLEKYKPDYYLFDSYLYNQLKGKIGDERLIEMGNAKYDLIFQASQEKRFPNGWEKLKGKKTVLWAVTHGIYHYKIRNNISFDIYIKAFLEYASNNTEMGFIFRPHFWLIHELIQYGFWNEDDLEQFKKYCIESPNIVYDDSDSYENAYSVADAILTETGCGITLSALPLLKPICILYRSKNNREELQNELLSNFYSVCNVEELITFFEMIKEGKDPMLEKRKQASDEYIKNFDGKNGERIKDFIGQRYALIAEK